MDTGAKIAVLRVQEVQQNHVLDLVNVRKDQWELENVSAKMESEEALATRVHQIISGRIVHKLVRLEVQAVFVLDTEHAMKEHRHRQAAFVLQVGKETIGKFAYFRLILFCCFKSNYMY